MASPLSVTALTLEQTDGNEFDGATVADYLATVFIFFAPQCPLSENYTLQTNTLSRDFESKNIQFRAVVTGKWYSREEINRFITQYQLQVPVVLDPDKQMAKWCNPAVTPEAIVCNTDGEIVYRGAIDNWATDLGTKREVVTAFYLRDVLQAITENKPLPYTETTAVGCIIE